MHNLCPCFICRTPSCFTPFGLRTEERAERRKKASFFFSFPFLVSTLSSCRVQLFVNGLLDVFQKLEEKFKAMEEEKEEERRSVGNKESKLRQRLCFKAKPLPNFYKQRPKSTDQTNKV